MPRLTAHPTATAGTCKEELDGGAAEGGQTVQACRTPRGGRESAFYFWRRKLAQRGDRTDAENGSRAKGGPVTPVSRSSSRVSPRGLCIGRRNWLCMGSERGGRAAAIHYRLLASCKRHGHDPWVYFRATCSPVFLRCCPKPAKKNFSPCSPTVGFLPNHTPSPAKPSPGRRFLPTCSAGHLCFWCLRQ